MSKHLVSPGSAITLASGSPAGAGETVDADPKNPHDKRLIDAGRLVELKTKRTSKPKEAE